MENIAFCALNCDACRIRVAVLDQDSRHLTAEVALRTNLSAMTTCGGCRDGIGCGVCAIRDCIYEKNQERINPLLHCGECENFPCAHIENFANDDKPHHKEGIENLYRICEIGMSAFLEEERVKWHCSSCGKRLSWYMRDCPDCMF